MAPPISVARNKPGRIMRGAVFAVGAAALAGIGSGRVVFTVVTVTAWAVTVVAWPRKG